MEWSALIAELTSRGMTQQKIAAACECAQSTISDLATGKNTKPSYQIGKTLEQLHAQPQPAAPATEPVAPAEAEAPHA